MAQDFKKVNNNFGLQPKATQVCKKHKYIPIEFYCEASNEFYCRVCADKHRGHPDICIAEVSSDVQNILVELKHIYLTKRTHIFDRLTGHQSKMEEFLSIYY